MAGCINYFSNCCFNLQKKPPLGSTSTKSKFTPKIAPRKGVKQGFASPDKKSKYSYEEEDEEPTKFSWAKKDNKDGYKDDSVSDEYSSNSSKPSNFKPEGFKNRASLNTSQPKDHFNSSKPFGKGASKSKTYDDDSTEEEPSRKQKKPTPRGRRHSRSPDSLDKSDNYGSKNTTNPNWILGDKSKSPLKVGSTNKNAGNNFDSFIAESNEKTNATTTSKTKWPWDKDGGDNVDNDNSYSVSRNTSGKPPPAGGRRTYGSSQIQSTSPSKPFRFKVTGFLSAV